MPALRAFAAIAIGLVIAAGIGGTKRSAAVAPDQAPVAGTPGLRKAI
jgi:hypothetical protein